MPCVFCGAQGRLTDEHVYPRWMRVAMSAAGPTDLTRGDARAHIRTDTGLTLLLRRGLCESCNTGWLSRMEREVEPWLAPALLGQKIALAPTTQRLVAAWAVGRALLIELAMRTMRKPTYAPASALRWLYERRDDPEPPPGCQVWMAAVDAQLGTVDSLVGWNRAGCSGSVAGEPEQFFVSFSAGYLVFQVAGQDFREVDLLTRSGAPLLDFHRPDALLSLLVAIWPERSDLVVWPPPLAVSRKDLSRLAAWGSTVGQRIVRVPTGSIAQTETPGVSD
jgi:hypothetical protein